MRSAPVDDAQRRAAKIVGLSYLLVIVPAIFAEFYVRGTLIDLSDSGVTATNVLDHELLFRLGIVSNLAVFAIDIALIAALYIVLRRVDQYLALVAVGWGVVETAILVVVVLSDLNALVALSGGGIADAFDPSQRQVLARLALGMHGDAYGLGLVFAGLRSTLFCWLWLRSRLIPRALATLGLLASALMGMCMLLFIILPELERAIPVSIYGGPILLFEIAIGLWLLLRPLPATAMTGPHGRVA